MNNELVTTEEERDAQVLPEFRGTPYDFGKCRTVMNPEEPIYDQDLLAAIHLTAGDKSQISQLLLRPRLAITNAIEKTPHIYEYWNQVREAIIDKAESNVFTAIEKGDTDLSKFVLTTLGKDRGYATRSEQNIKAQGAIDLNVKPTRELAKALARTMSKTGLKIVDLHPEEFKRNGDD